MQRGLCTTRTPIATTRVDAHIHICDVQDTPILPRAKHTLHPFALYTSDGTLCDGCEDVWVRSNHVMCRAKLWRAATPEQAPVAQDVDWEALGQGYQLAGGSIKQAVVRAATHAALRLEVTPPRPASASLFPFHAMFSACTCCCFSGHCEHQGCSVVVLLAKLLTS